MTPKCKIESWNTQVSSSSQETPLRKSCFLEDRDSKEGQARSVPVGTMPPSVLLSMHVDPHHVTFVSIFSLQALSYPLLLERNRSCILWVSLKVHNFPSREVAVYYILIYHGISKETSIMCTD